MSKQKVTNTDQITTGVVKEMSETAKCREILASIYATQAERMFVGIAVRTFHKTDTEFISEEEVRNTLNRVNAGDCVLIYTQPSDECNVTEDMRVASGGWNKVLPIGQRWYVKEAHVTDAFVLLRAYTNYLRFKADSDRALLRSAKKVVSEMTQEELIAFILKAQDNKTDNNEVQNNETDNNGKQD